MKDKTILVTGAGGTIGSEICRHLASLGPNKLILLGHSEYPIYALNQSLPCHSVPVLADVRDVGAMFRVMQQYRPDYVFHAAAIKHVPLAEVHPREAYLTNTIGTRNTVIAAAYTGATVVMISTDKAVYPESVMGKTKRIAERFCFGVPGVKVVRFGNVWGSSGSVVPLFQRQIAEGGPVTVTDPDMTRYFMTVDKAANLAMHAALHEHEDNLFIADMGEPRPIVDVARELIDNSGQSIEIKITGARPGERLTENLFYKEEGSHEGWRISRTGIQ